MNRPWSLGSCETREPLLNSLENKKKKHQRSRSLVSIASDWLEGKLTRQPITAGLEVFESQ